MAEYGEFVIFAATSTNKKMPRLRLKLDARKVSKSEKYPLVILITQGSTSAHLPTGIRLQPSQWDDSRRDGAKIIAHPQAAVLNRIASSKLAEATIQAAQIPMGKARSMSAAQIKTLISRTDEEEVRPIIYVGDYFRKFAQAKEKQNTRESFDYTLKKLDEYCDVDKLQFVDITIPFLKDWVQQMSATCGVNTRAIHLENLRAVINSAIDDELLSQDKYPFRRFKIKREAAEKRSITLWKLVQLRDYPCEPYQEKYRDMFMLSFYLAGINLKDLLELPPMSNLVELTYKRNKSNVLWSGTIPREAREIIEKYRGTNHLLIFGDKYKNYKDFLSRINKELKKIGLVTRSGLGGKKERKPILPDLTFYSARHTWATIAADIDIPEATIDMALAHKSPYIMTEVYIRKNLKKTNAAMRAVIDELKRGEAISKVVQSLIR